MRSNTLPLSTYIFSTVFFLCVLSATLFSFYFFAHDASAQTCRTGFVLSETPDGKKYCQCTGSACENSDENVQTNTATQLPVPANGKCPVGYIFSTSRGGAGCIKSSSGGGLPTGGLNTGGSKTTGGLMSGGGRDAAQWPTSGGAAGLKNPLAGGGINSLEDLLLAILNVLIIFAIPVIIFFIIYAGFLYVTARGNETTVGKAHRTLLYAVIGGLLILGAEALLTVIQGTVEQIR